jgi:hypothetical protein
MTGKMAAFRAAILRDVGFIFIVISIYDKFFDRKCENPFFSWSSSLPKMAS